MAVVPPNEWPKMAVLPTLNASTAAGYSVLTISRLPSFVRTKLASCTRVARSSSSLFVLGILMNG